MGRESLEEHEFPCSTCGKSFKSRDRNHLACSRSGRNVFCSQPCRRKKINEMQVARPGRHICGPCPTCGEHFRSKAKGKLYCSQACYSESDQLQQHLLELKEKQSFEWKCHHCGKDAPRKRKFCNDFCRRTFFAERFDRFIANPEELSLPQNYDEFLDRDELPCLIEGCDWVGVGLSHHVNHAHGISSEKFKELGGFNRTTALMGVAARKARSEQILRLIEEGIIFPSEDRYPVWEAPNSGTYELRPEGKEHWAKAMALNEVFKKLSDGGRKYSQSEKGRKASSERLKKTRAEQPLIELVCNYCGCKYTTQKWYAAKSKWCSQKCRNGNNNKKRQK